MSVTSRPLRQASAADESYSRLRAMLVNKEFLPGSRLLETELTTQLGVSRTPLREALRRLQGDGLVTLAGRGAIVAKRSPSEIGDLYRYRAALEGFTAERVAERQNEGELAPKQLKRLRELLEDVEESAAPANTAVANLALHRYIADLSANSFVIDALSRVWDIIELSSEENLEEDRTWRGEMDLHHRDIVSAIEAGESERAQRLARDHVRAAGEVYMRQHADRD